MPCSALVFLVVVLGITIEKLTLTPVCIDKRNSWLRFAGVDVGAANMFYLVSDQS